MDTTTQDRFKHEKHKPKLALPVQNYKARAPLANKVPKRIKNPYDGKNKWTSKESLIILSLILILLFSLMQFVYDYVWESIVIAFQMLSGIIFFLFIIIFIVGIRFFILDRQHLWAHEREGLVLFIIGSSITLLLPIFGSVAGESPEVFFENNTLVVGIGTVLIFLGAILVARFGGFYSIWFFGLSHYIVMSSHEAFLIMIYTHHFGTYDQYYGSLGLFLILLSVILFIYHELKFLYLGKLIKRATDLRLNGRYKEAIKPLQTALKIYPRYATAWNNKGNVLTKLGNYKEAIKCYDRALAISPNFEIAKMNRTLAVQKIRA